MVCAADEHHGHTAQESGATEEKHPFHPHAPGWAINLVLAVLAASSIASVSLAFIGHGHGGWAGDMIASSSAKYESPFSHISSTKPMQGEFYRPAYFHRATRPQHPGTFLGRSPHEVMYYASAIVGLTGILIAAYLHGPVGIAGLFLGSRRQAARSRADALAPALGPLATWARHKWYVDEFYNQVVRIPLLVIAHLCNLIDKLLVDGLVNAAGWAPKGVGSAIRPSQSGLLHGYAVGMAGGIGVLLVIVLLAMR